MKKYVIEVYKANRSKINNKVDKVLHTLGVSSSSGRRGGRRVRQRGGFGGLLELLASFTGLVITIIGIVAVGVEVDRLRRRIAEYNAADPFSDEEDDDDDTDTEEEKEDEAVQRRHPPANRGGGGRHNRYQRTRRKCHKKTRCRRRRLKLPKSPYV